jgi:hypothetical protein
MKNSWLARGLVALMVGSALASAAACNSEDSSADPDASGGGDPSDDDGEAGSPDGAGGGDAAGGSGDSGTVSAGGTTGEAGSDSVGGAGAPTADALPAGTFLYVYSQTADSDWLVARDFETGEERVVTDLRGDGSEGWEIWGHSISPDRRRIALASLYAPTDADVATGLSTRRIFTLATDGSDFQRLTPVFPNTGEGRTGFNISIEDPAFSADGSAIIYDMGNWWYEGTTLEGGSAPWYVATTGDELPALFPTSASCTIVAPSVNPATGDILLVHSVCLSSDDEGLFLYPIAGGAPAKLVDRGYGAGAVDPALEKASWLGDGSGFVFVGSIEVDRGDNVTETARSLLLFDMTSGDITALVIPDPDTHVRNGAISPEGTSIVYCLDHEGGLDLHAIDLTLDPLVDSPLTNDGKSCAPGF